MMTIIWIAAGLYVFVLLLIWAVVGVGSGDPKSPTE